MKKLMIFIGFLILITSFPVQAKDNLYSFHKYQEENYSFLEESYDSKGISDGMMVGGSFLNDHEKYQTILVKYKKNGDIKWTYTYEAENENFLEDLDYSYQEDGKIDGYLLTIKEYSSQVEQKNKEKTVFLKIDLDGQVVFQKSSDLEKSEVIKEIVPIYQNQEEKLVTGYVAIASIDEEKSLVIEYDRELNPLWYQEYHDEDYEKTECTDITFTKEDYFLLCQKEKDNLKTTNLLRLNREEKSITSFLTSRTEYDSSYIEKTEEGFLLYGATSEVKLKKGSTSYYLENYDKNGNLLWESIGEIPVDKNNRMILSSGQDGYFLFYKNEGDLSYEVLKFNKEGLIEKKVKKIHNNYYEFENFLTIEDTLYFVGIITCPEEDSCDYQKTSLFLISDEDKVVEVQAKGNNKNILIGIGFVFVIVFVTVLFSKRKRKLQNSL